MGSIPLIDIAPLFNGPSADRDRADREIAEAAAGVPCHRLRAAENVSAFLL